MKEKEISCKEVIEKLEDAYNKGVIITCKGEFGSVMITNTDHLQIYNTDDKITLEDDSNTSVSINKSSIVSTNMSDFDVTSEKIDFDLGSMKMSFIICN